MRKWSSVTITPCSLAQSEMAAGCCLSFSTWPRKWQGSTAWGSPRKCAVRLPSRTTEVWHTVAVGGTHQVRAEQLEVGPERQPVAGVPGRELDGARAVGQLAPARLHELVVGHMLGPLDAERVHQLALAELVVEGLGR